LCIRQFAAGLAFRRPAYENRELTQRDASHAPALARPGVICMGASRYPVGWRWVRAIGIVGSSCDKLFRAWQRRLDKEPDWWLIRDVVTHRCWRNRALRERYRELLPLQTASPIIDWHQSLSHCHIEDQPRVENACSNALKTGRPQVAQVRIRGDATHLITLWNVFYSAQCAGCRRRCGLVLIHALGPPPAP
jgi:hypothetical protein